MELIEKKNKIATLREELRSGRINQSSEDLSADNRDDDSETGATFQATGGAVTAPAPVSVRLDANKGKPRSHKRGATKQPVRVGQPDRRLGQNNGGSVDNTAAASPAAAKKKGSNKPEQVAAKQKKERSWGGKLMSKQEAEEIQEPLQEAFKGNFHDLDRYLWERQKAVGIDSNEQPVWGDLDTEENEALAKVLLRWSQRNAAVATTTRAIVESRDYIQVGTIFAPRIKRTVAIMRETRKPIKRRGQQNETNL